MKYSIIGTGAVGRTLAAFFDKAGVEVGFANTRGRKGAGEIAAEVGPHVVPMSLEDAVDAEIIFFAVQFLNFKDVGRARSDWSGRIVVDVTNAAFLPQDVQDRELQGRLSSAVNAGRVPGAKLVKAFNQLPMQALAGPVPKGSKRVVFISSDYEDGSAAVAELAAKLGFAPIEIGKIAEGGRLIQAKNALVFQNLVKLDT